MQLLIIISILPVFLIGLYIYKKSKDKENSKLLFKLLGGGVGSCFLVLILSIILEYFFPFLKLDENSFKLSSLFVQVFVGIALVEEFCKWLVSYTMTYNDPNFDELYDMLLYCTFVALGFAGLENLMYVFSNGLVTGLLRGISSVPAHASFGIIMGYYLGLSKINSLNKRNDLKRKNIILSILIPTILHGIFDFLLFRGTTFLFIIWLIFVLILFIYVIKKIKKISKLSKFRYQDNYCSNCGWPVNSDYCPKCGHKNN